VLPSCTVPSAGLSSGRAGPSGGLQGRHSNLLGTLHLKLDGNNRDWNCLIKRLELLVLQLSGEAREPLLYLQSGGNISSKWWRYGLLVRDDGEAYIQ